MAIEKIDGMSMDVEQEERDKLRAVFPQCFAEGKLDIDKLLTLCGTYMDDDFEKYEFKWKGKRDYLKLAQMRSTATLRPYNKEDESIDFDTTKNLYIEGDNLEVLKLLQKAYFRRVKMIYIDPPYNTGNDFVYEDDFADTLANYKEVTSQATKSNSETMGRFHTNWLNMIYPRLRLSANLLRDDDVIFISIDDGEQANLRKICDEVFGEENFVANILWQKRYSPANDHKTICPMHDFVIVYRKSELWERNLLARTEKNDAQYRYEDERGIFRPDNYKCNKTAEERPNLYYPITQPNTGEEIWPSKDAVWRYSKERHAENVQQNLVFWGKDGVGKVPAYKRYRDQLRGGGGTVPGTWWTFEFAGHNEEAVKETGELIGNRIFSTPKPIRLIQRMLQLSTAPESEDIILDFFSGSSSAAHVVMQQNAEDGGNRQFIMVQLPEIIPEKSETYEAGFKNICEIGKERIRRAGAQLRETAERLDIGFKVFKLDTSNLKTWDSSRISKEEQGKLGNRLNAMIQRVKPDRTDLDMVYEVMLKLGVPLDFPVTKLDVNGTAAYSVGEDSLPIVCLAPNLSVETLEQLADYAPAKMILAETSFADDSAMSNAYYALRDRGIGFKFV